MQIRSGLSLADYYRIRLLHVSRGAKKEVKLLPDLMAMLLHQPKWSARFIQPGKPWHNCFIESFHSTLRRDPLEVEVLFHLLDAELKTGNYRNYTNQVRPHSAPGYKAPAEVATMKARSLLCHWVTYWGQTTRTTPVSKIRFKRIKLRWGAMRVGSILAVMPVDFSMSFVVRSE